MRRVVITGVGPVTGLGTGKEDFFTSLINGKSGINKIDTFDVSGYNCQIAGLVKGFNPTDFIEPKQTKRMDRFSQYAVVAAKLALEDANFVITSDNCNRVGVIIGSGIGGLQTLETQHIRLLDKGPSKVSPFLIPMMISNMASGNTSITFGAKGYNSCSVTACSSASHSIGEAFEVIKRGQAEVMIAGGSEAAVTPLGLAGFDSMKALSTNNTDPEKASRPFEAKRDGFVMGEGAGVLILEEIDHAQKRGARIYAELAGYGATADAYHITAPDPTAETPARAMRQALQESKIEPREVDYINAHGTSTLYNDKYETLAIKKVFGDDAYKVSVSSTKSMTGHLLGAAGGIESIVCAMTIESNIIPPTINYENPDPDCDLDYVPNKARETNVDIALSNTLGFGGHNAVLAFKKI